jgi:hypothetical protein
MAYVGYRAYKRDPNLPSNLRIMSFDEGFGEIPDHQQGVRCKAPRSDE